MLVASREGLCWREPAAATPGMPGLKAGAAFGCSRSDASWCHAPNAAPRESGARFRGTPRWFPLAVRAGKPCQDGPGTPSPAGPFPSAFQAGKAFCDPPQDGDLGGCGGQGVEGSTPCSSRSWIRPRCCASPCATLPGFTPSGRWGFPMPGCPPAGRRAAGPPAIPPVASPVAGFYSNGFIPAENGHGAGWH